MRFLLIGNPENRRVTYFQHACKAIGLESPLVLSWEAILQDFSSFQNTLKECDALRIDSSGENYNVYNLLVRRGGSIDYFSEADYLKGRIGHLEAWYKGWNNVLSEIESNLDKDFSVMNSPREISLLFDKYTCQKYLSERGLPIPSILGKASNAREVYELMLTNKTNRVFIKPSHSSSASGVVALQRAGSCIMATTSVENRDNALYNSLKINRYTIEDEISQLLNLLGK